MVENMLVSSVYDINCSDDEEKMKDFFYLSKERFLESYSYLTEEEYNLTLKKVNDLETS